MAESERGQGTGSPGEPAQDGGPSTREHSGYARSRVREQASRIRQRAEETGQQVKETAEQKAEQLKQEAARKTDELTSRVGGRIATLARAMRRAGEELRGEGEERIAQMTDRAAEQVERIGSYLDGSKPDRMWSDMEGMARANPGFFVGGTFAMGLLLGRFLRSSEADVDVVFEPEGDWATDGAPSGGASDGLNDPDVESALTSERASPERAMTPDLENVSAEHPSTAPEHVGDETPVRSAYPGHETTGPGVRTGSSGAAALDAGSAGPYGERRDNIRPMRRRDEEGA